MSDEDQRHSSQKVEGRTGLDLVQDEVDEAKMWRSKQPRTKLPKQQSRWDRQWRRCHRSGNCWAQTRSRPTNEDGSRKNPVEKLYEAVNEEGRLLSSKDVTAQCIDFCKGTTSEVHAVLRHAPADLRGRRNL